VANNSCCLWGETFASAILAKAAKILPSPLGVRLTKKVPKVFVAAFLCGHAQPAERRDTVGVGCLGKGAFNRPLTNVELCRRRYCLGLELINIAPPADRNFATLATFQ